MNFKQKIIEKPFYLKQFIIEMKNTLTYNIDQALLLIQSKLNDSSAKYNSIIQITARYNLIKNNSLNGTYSKEEFQRFHAQIIIATLELLDSLREDDILIDNV